MRSLGFLPVYFQFGLFKYVYNAGPFLSGIAGVSMGFFDQKIGEKAPEIVASSSLSEDSFQAETVVLQKPSSAGNRYAVVWGMGLGLCVLLLVLMGVLLLNVYRLSAGISVTTRHTEVRLAQQKDLMSQLQVDISSQLLKIQNQLETNAKGSSETVQKHQAEMAELASKISVIESSVLKVQAQLGSFYQGTVEGESTGIHKVTDAYHIFGVEPYGVVLQDREGNFEVARIGRLLSVGEIKLITAHEVLAGSWAIVHQPAARA